MIVAPITRFRHRLLTTILLLVMVTLLVTVVLTSLVTKLFNEVHWSTHSSQVIIQAHLSEKLTIDLETGLRGYLLTGDPAFLEPYRAARIQLPPLMEDLSHLVSDNSAQENQLKKIQQTQEDWLRGAEAALQASYAGSPNPDVATARTRKATMDQLRNQFQEFIAMESQLGHQRYQQVQHSQKIFIQLGLLLAIGVLVGLAYSIRRQFYGLSGDYAKVVANLENQTEELRVQKELFQVTLDSIGDCVIATDPQGKITFMNPEAEKMTGWKLAEAKGQSLETAFRIIHEETRAPVESPVTKVLRENKTVGLANHTILLSRDGTERAIDDSAAPIRNTAGHILGVVLVFHDATELRAAATQLKNYSIKLEQDVAERTQSLQQTVGEMEAFSYTVSHDLRSPLRAMQGYAKVLLEDYEDKLDEEGVFYLQRIKNASERLDHLIQDLLAYTRVAKEHAPLQSVDLDKLTREIVDQYPSFQAPHAAITIEGTLLPVQGRELLITQIISNLLSNATRFVPQGTTPKIRLWTEARGDMVRLWVEDNGIGIAPENFERIFKIFEQVNDQKMYGGTGIGLAIVKKAALTMGGNLGVESVVGQGSRFWAEFKQKREL
jgi:PAS domain S-box-containing protein